MAIAVDLHLMILGVIIGLLLVSSMVHLALRRGSALGWMAAALLCVSVELLILRYGTPSRLGVAAIAMLIPAIYFCASQAVRRGAGLPLTGHRVVLAATLLTALSLVLLAMPVPPTLQYMPFQLAGILVFFDTTLALARKRTRDSFENGLVALCFVIIAGVVLRVPMFPTLLGEPTPWAPFDAASFERVFIQCMGVLNTSFALLVLARIVTDVIAGYRHSSERDGLTELLNRRAFDAVVDTSAPSSGAIVMCDIDRFKTINDRFGHHVGDEVIRSFARMIGRRGEHAGASAGKSSRCCCPPRGSRMRSHRPSKSAATFVACGTRPSAPRRS
ncbi:GGDEF domain-containing protein [Alteriqipengyuania lutimaris]|uniref:GGDEF domain-containing protein n=1 Tax=Alteriqipengyuania lutimaris TaxID=1538146 RepID=UPI0017BDB0EB|nr:GGDEF domain-containing protein [Alteriqipengyuania lutimaris]MBB3034646.1 GGDEF domain-containing protein [Alteriqipengyuania lutimaris]